MADIVEFPRSPGGDVDPGTWWRSGDLVWIKCPTGHLGRLDPRNHRVRQDGTVERSVRCADGTCDWHESIRLLDWDPAHSGVTAR